MRHAGYVPAVFCMKLLRVADRNIGATCRREVGRTFWATLAGRPKQIVCKWLSALGRDEAANVWVSGKFEGVGSNLVVELWPPGGPRGHLGIQLR